MWNGLLILFPTLYRGTIHEKYSPIFSKVPLRGRIKEVSPNPARIWELGFLPRIVSKKQLKKSAVMTLPMISPTVECRHIWILWIECHIEYRDPHRINHSISGQFESAGSVVQWLERSIWDRSVSDSSPTFAILFAFFAFLLFSLCLPRFYTLCLPNQEGSRRIRKEPSLCLTESRRSVTVKILQ